MPIARTCWTASVALLLALAAPLSAADDYKLGADSERQPNVPQGKLTTGKLTTSKIFPGTEHDYSVYVPAQYDGKEPACVTVFFDGSGFASDKGSYRATVVLDNLIARKEIPVTVGVFVNPGVVPVPAHAVAGKNAKGDEVKPLPRMNRSYEYDSTSDLNARFLLDELLPVATKDLNVVKGGNGRAVCGASSGGIAAFVAAWERPNEFSRVISFIGSYTNLRGGNDVPSIVRKTEGKPIRVFLQDGSNDLDIYAGSWWVGNNDMLAALRFAGYEHQWAPRRRRAQRQAGRERAAGRAAVRVEGLPQAGRQAAVRRGEG